MLALKIDGQFVDLPDDFSVTMNLKSPIFGEVGSYSYPYRLPNTPKNAAIMGFRHRVENTTDVYQTADGVIQWNGIEFFKGTVQSKAYSAKSIEGTVFEGEGDFFFMMKKLTLQDVDLGSLDFDSMNEKLAYINACAGQAYPDIPAAFPQVLNKQYYEEMPESYYFWYFNYYDNGAIKEKYGTPRAPIVPMLYLRYVLDKVFDTIGLNLDDQFFAEDDDYNHLCLFNLVDCNSDTGGYFAYDQWSLYWNYHVPRMTLADFMNALQTFFNIRFFVNNKTGIVRMISVDEIVKATDYIDLSGKVISMITEVEQQITGYHLKMDMESEDEYWTAIASSQTTVVEHIKPAVQSLSDLPPWPAGSNLDIRYVYDEDAFYLLYNKVWGTSLFFTESIGFYSETIIYNDDQMAESKGSTLMNETNTPYAVAAGAAMEDWKDLTLKLFFEEYIPAGGGVAFHSVIGKNRTDSKYLFYGEETGIMNQHYRAFIDFRIKAKLVKIVRQMTFSELKDFDFSRKYMISGVKYLVKSIQVSLKKDRIMPATLECYTCD